MTDVGALYQDLILEHHRNPRNTGKLPDATHSGDANNPLCGDRASLTLRVEAGKVTDARCDVLGCAICRASSSMLTEAIIGKSVDETLALTEQFLALVAGPDAPDGDRGLTLGPLLAFARVREFPNRARCATLSWEALRSALSALAPPAVLD
jgi:nitrogen fixation protein NifU and related proteins